MTRTVARSPLTALAALLALSVSGCASVTGSKLQPVSVQTIQDSKEVAGVGCTLTNDAGKWFVTTPGSVTIQKSTDDLLVDCSKDKVTAGRTTIVSKANGNVWGNIILGGGIGYVVDRQTGAGFDYPSTITVILQKMSETPGLAPMPGTAAVPLAPTAQAAPQGALTTLK